MKPLAIFLTLLFAALLTPEPVFARKKPAVARPASKPLVYKKLDNRKKKSTFKFGRPEAL